MMMTMDSQTDTTRARKLLKLLKRFLKQDHLFTDEQLIEMKANLKVVEEEINMADAKNFKGFGKK